MTTGQQEQRTPPPSRQHHRTFQGLLVYREQRTLPSTPPGLQYLSEELRAGRIRQWNMEGYTAASGLLDHATFRELVDASVRCSGFEAMLRHADRPTRHGPGIANDL